MAQQENNTGVGALELLTLLFITLKLLDVITWSWWWVLSPVLIPIAIAILTLTIYGLKKYDN